MCRGRKDGWWEEGKWLPVSATCHERGSRERKRGLGPYQQGLDNQPVSTSSRKPVFRGRVSRLAAYCHHLGEQENTAGAQTLTAVVWGPTWAPRGERHCWGREHGKSPPTSASDLLWFVRRGLRAIIYLDVWLLILACFLFGSSV